MKFESRHIIQLADLITPVGAYLRLRSSYSELILLESTDYHSAANSKSFICFEPLTTFSVLENQISIKTRDKTTIETEQADEVLNRLSAFKKSIQPSNKMDYQGLFGYNSFESTQYFDTHNYDYSQRKHDIPDIQYSFYRFVLVFNHFNNELELIENIPNGEDSKLSRVQRILNRQDTDTFPFKMTAPISSSMTDEYFMDLVKKGKHHCQQGDVFQIVFSRPFHTEYAGDDFCVYRALRSINPSPYLFYFDYGSFKIFGSSPEAQLVVNNNIAEIHPIAGTYIRTGDDEHDAKEAKALQNDPKENAEHVMLVDLARNDLSRNCTNVTVSKYKEVQYFSHVIHLVSRVTGSISDSIGSLKIFGDTFPAGTLSGAPKHRAINLIKSYEKHHRTFYGGAIGYMSLSSDSLNTAIIIRSFLSMDNKLHFQAGAGIVIDSVPEKELQEVNNKLAALTKALKLGESV
ncbi:MAG: anthranilate synthase component I family protein [Saprospiraceae bacterium]